MSLAQPPQTDRGASPLMSNNPFRNRIATTAPNAAQPVSTNPFLDTHEVEKKQPTSTVRPVSSDNTNGATELLSSMTLERRDGSPSKRQISPTNGVPRRPENVPPRSPRGQPMGHRPTLSEEERRRQQANSTRRGTEMDIFADPSDARRRVIERERLPRRNSESSVMEKSGPMDADEEKRRRERRYREAKRSDTTRTKPSKKLDVIDKLDVTSIYGTGLFHHDGPFDACNPHRNRRRHKLAPMQAFPKDSENMKIGGSGPVNKTLDYNKFHGFGQEAHIDFNEARQEQTVFDEDAAYINTRPQQPDRSTSFNATARVDPVHGAETAGLGTSTFLEGAPASKAAIQRRESEFEAQQQQQLQVNGLSRKKSLAQKIRAVRPGGSGRITSPDRERPPQSPPLNTGRSDNGANPFFRDYDTEYDRKGQQIAIAEEQSKTGRARAPSSPKQDAILERSITTGSIDAPQQESKPIGLLGRMKSLKKSKPRYERRDPS